MLAFRDLTGARINHWRVLSRSANRYSRVMWLCRCICGHERVVSGAHLASGASSSCGCQRPRGEDHHNYLHGQTDTSLHGTWMKMIDRCENPKNKRFSIYGGKGVKLCPRWRNDFAAFAQDMGPRPSPQHSIDRIDGDGDYAPDNCRWATAKEQARNMCRNRVFTIAGETKTLVEWVELRGRNYGTVKWRLNHGQGIEEALR